MNSKQVVLITGSSTGSGEFSEQWWKPMRISTFLVRAVLAITVAGVAAKANAQSIDELLSGGGPAGLYEPWVREFEQRFPGIKVKLTADFSNILAPIIDRETAERKLSVDLTIFQTFQDYGRWKKQGVLMSFRPEGWDQIIKVSRIPTASMLAWRFMPCRMPTTLRPSLESMFQDRSRIS
jgi:hypothetical protein